MLPLCPQFIIGEVVVGHVEALEAGQVAEHVLPHVVDDVVRHVQPLEVPRASEDAVGEDGHPVVGEVHLLQLVGDPLGLGEHLLGDEGDPVEGEVQPPDAEAVVEEAVGLVLELLQAVVAQVDVPQRHEAREGARRHEAEVVMAQVHVDQLKKYLEFY